MDAFKIEWGFKDPEQGYLSIDKEKPEDAKLTICYRSNIFNDVVGSANNLETTLLSAEHHLLIYNTDYEEVYEVVIVSDDLNKPIKIFGIRIVKHVIKELIRYENEAHETIGLKFHRIKSEKIIEKEIEINHRFRFRFFFDATYQSYNSGFKDEGEE